MRIRILRSTIVTPLGQLPQPADPGAVVEVDRAQGEELVHLGKAAPIVQVAPPAVELAVDPAAVAAEKRGRRKS